MNFQQQQKKTKDHYTKRCNVLIKEETSKEEDEQTRCLETLEICRKCIPRGNSPYTKTHVWGAHNVLQDVEDCNTTGNTRDSRAPRGILNT